MSFNKYHKKRRKGARSHFCRPKSHSVDKENSPPQAKLDYANVALPPHWQFISSQFCKIEEVSGHCVVTASVAIDSEKCWSAHVHGKEIPRTCKILSQFTTHIDSELMLCEVIATIDNSVLCPGNPDAKFVAIYDKKGEVKGERGNGSAVAIVEEANVEDMEGTLCSKTIRRLDCDVIIDRGCFHCDNCRSFRKTLRSACSRKKVSSSKAEPSSHAKYSSLTGDEKSLRLKNIHQSLRKTQQQLKRMKEKIAMHLEKNSVSLVEEDANDIQSIVGDASPMVEKNFAPDSPERIFWEQQVNFNALKSKRQMKWHPLVIRFALNLKYMSSSAYNAVRQSGVIHLPSQRTLSDYTHWITPHAGVQLEFVERFASFLEDVPCKQRHCALLMDEMKLKSGLVFNKHSGAMVGFVDLGTVNSDLQQILGKEPTDEKIASQTLVFMVRAIFKPSLTLPIAHYFSSNLKGEQIFPLVWEVIEALELYDIPIVSLTSDGACPNRRFYSICQPQPQKRNTIPNKTCNPFRDAEDVFFICDVPHLLKTARNCFSNSFAHFCKRKMERNGQAISWKWIEHLYLSETSTDALGVRLCHKLTRDHIWLTSFTRMRVYLAAQVMSESVASALQILNEKGTRETRIFIRMVDKFFDCLNVKSPLLSTLKRKDNIAPYTSPSDERFKWLREDFIGYLVQWQKQVNCLPLKPKERQKRCLSRQTILGMKITVSSFTELGPKLLQLPDVEYLLSEVFSQDPLERYFSRQRHRGGSNDNPTAHQVPFSASTLVQQQSMYRDIKNMNIEREDDSSDWLDYMSQPLPKRKK